MSSFYTFLDVETPNWGNDSICSIGIIRADASGNVMSKDGFLVDPEAHFDSMNIAIHGITPEMVKGKPTFADIWDDFLGEYLSDSVIVAHNATFDLSVMRKAMESHGLGDLEATYECTYWMARRAFPDWGCWKLPNTCRNLGISLRKHHDALADAEACMEIFSALLSGDFGSCSPSRYSKGHKVRAHRPRTFSSKTEKLRCLIELLKTVEEDGALDIDEGMEILSFIASDNELLHDKSLSSIVSLLQEAVSDGEIGPEESSALSREMDTIIDPVSSNNRGPSSIEFDGKTFCLTGEFEHGSRDKEVAPLIEQRGGLIKKNVVKKLDYLVVGSRGSQAYSLETYGGKVKKALDFNSSGADIKIVTETDLFDAFGAKA